MGVVSAALRRQRPLLFGGAILLCAGLMFATGHKNPVRAKTNIAPVSASVAVAAAPIAAGRIIAAADVKLQQIAGVMPPEALAASQAIGRIAISNIAAGGLLSGQNLQDAPQGIAARLTEGRRAFSFRVAQDDIVGGFLQSGDHVDALAVIPGAAFPQKGADGTADRSKVLLLLQDVQVLAVGDSLNANGAVQSNAQTVSLSVEPEQLVRLALALRLGKVSLAIRRAGDNDVSPVTGATLEELTGATSAPVAPPLRAAQPVQADDTGRVPFLMGTQVSALKPGAAP